jgi:RNA 2',3'-cyclic 3'-phosphodiesterase
LPENNSEKARLFIAVELPKSTIDELSRLQKNLQTAYGNSGARWVAVKNIHLTLNFLGDVLRSKIPDISLGIAQAVAGFIPFELILGRLGAFPDIESPSTVWVGLNGIIGQLFHLQHNLEQILFGLGFKSEKRPFRPHLTLARISDGVLAADKKRLGQIIDLMTCNTDYPIPVHSVCLIESQLTPGGPIYTVRSRIGFSRQL